MENKIKFRCGLLDFQMGREYGKFAFNPAEYIKECAKSGMERVIFTCKDTGGDAYYKSELVELNPAAGSDYLARAIKEAKRQNIELYAYYNVLLDDIYAGAHPEHMMVNSKGEKVIAYDYFKCLCPNSPYMDVVRERIADLVFNYDVEGIFFDITYFRGNDCFCDSCKAKFHEEYGYALKNNVKSGTSEYADFNEFKRNSRAKLLMELTDTVKEIRSIPVIWNGSGSFYLAEPEIDRYSDYLTTEFHAPNYLDGIIRAKWMQSRKMGFIMSTTSEIGSWGDWTVIPEIIMKSVVCTVAAHGGGLFIDHTPYPYGEFAKSKNKYITDVTRKSYDYLMSYEEYLSNSESAADVVVVMPISTKRFYSNGFNNGSMMDFTNSIKGAVKMMLESGIPFDVADEMTLMENGGHYDVLIFPCASYIDDKFTKWINNFVNEGGKIIAAGDIGMYREFGKMSKQSNIRDVLGIDFIGYSDTSVEYMADMPADLTKGIPDMPILIKKTGKLVNVTEVNGAAKLSTKVLPPFEATIDRHVYHQHGHPFKRSDYASVVANKYGKGESVYFSADIFRSFYLTASPWLKRIFLNILGMIHPKPVVSIGPSPYMYPTLMKNKKGYLLQLINMNGTMSEPAKSYPIDMLRIPEAVIRTTLDFKNAVVVSENKDIKLEQSGELTMKDIGVHTAIMLYE
ncbi:MAG: alpha-L-fucosidase [Clostridiales bacterium]|nr:alpha-L-fucosidase [Clostridiales bacterium]